MVKGVSVKDVAAPVFIKAYSQHLKKSGITLPTWVDIVKTGIHKELAPYDPDWYFIRAASMARKLYLRGGIGVGTFRRIYGGPKNRGVAPHHFAKSSGSVARHILMQLEKISIIEKDTKGGRKISPKGRSDLDRIAGQILN